MESLVDVVTTCFKATLAVCAIFTAGYATHPQRALNISEALAPLSRRILLPCQVFVVLSASVFLTWSRFLQILWPILVVNLASHTASVVFGLLVTRYFTSPEWMLDYIVYNNVSSYPLAIVYALAMVTSTDGNEGLTHLKWHTMDSKARIASQATLYVIINFLVVKVCRLILSTVLERALPKRVTPMVDDDDEEDVPEATAAEGEDATERTPLVNRTATTKKSTSGKLFDTFVSPLSIAAVLGLLIALIKPVQQKVIGYTIDEQVGSGFWQSIGVGLSIIAVAFVAVDLVAVGATVKAGEIPQSEHEKVPPTLGNVLTIVLWRFGVIPAMVISMVRAFHRIPSTTYYLQDPAFGFVLALSTIAPPSILLKLNMYSSSVFFSTFYTSLLACLPIALALAFTGRGVSYELNFDLVRALKSAGGGGVAGAAAMVIQVLALMPLRTIMNYQYRYGGGFKESTKKLWNDGGFKRYYAGLGAAIFQGPFARFGDTAANAGILALLESLTWPVLVKTVAGSFAAACFRMVLTPIDTIKTTQQTKGGKAGLKLLRDRVKEKGIGCLWYGALATAAATFVGNYPWFGTYNFLQEHLPPSHTLIQQLFRQAFIGFAASVVSDTVSNSLRVVKTYRQVHETDVPYFTAAKDIVASEGLLGLFGRGLQTRILTNGLQGLIFSILWKLFADLINKGGK